MTAPLPGITDPGPIKHAQEGMPVLDRHGDQIGTVADIKMGDPEAVTGQGQQSASAGGLLGVVARSLGAGSGLPRQEQERLLRLGYLRIDLRGLLSGDTYIASDHITGVANGRVRIDLSAADLQGH